VTLLVTRPDAGDAALRLAELEREVVKLRRINQVLIERVERSMDFQGSAFSLFQTAIVLEEKIRARTLALERTLADLELSYLEAAAAKEQAETAQTRLRDAIESISEGFALFDADDRLVLFNQRYLTFWPGLSDSIQPDMPFVEVVRLAVQRKCVVDAYREPEEWVRRRLRQHADPQGPSIHALSDGRWIQVNEKRTLEGGIVCIYTDITDLKRRETLQHEAELAEKTTLLQATLDNIFEGVAVYDHELRLVAWNNEFVRLLDLPPACVRPGAGFADFLAFSEQLGPHGITQVALLLPDGTRPSLKFEQSWRDNRILEIQRNAMPDGGFVLTFIDITMRKHAEEALRDGERRIRLITDAMPALIAYVDGHERYQFVNETYRQWLDRAEAEILGRSMRAILAPQLYAGHKEFIDRALGGETVVFEIELTPASVAEPSHGQVTFAPHIGEEHEILGFFILVHDITERRRISEVLKEAKESLERRVDERTAALTRLNAQLQQEIADRREVEQALQAAKSVAEQANLGKTRFLAAASHDLLQPLNAARLFVSALSDLDQNRQRRTLINNVDASLSAVEDLLGTLLDISRLDSGGIKPDIVDFPIGTLLVPLTAEHVLLARERGLTFRFVPSSAVVRSDVRLLRRILQNFLSNAMRYTRNGSVLLGCRRSAEGLRVEVWDTGPGIPADKTEEIFEEFYQLHPSPRPHDRGMGLGLATVRRVARMLEIPIEVRSAVGRGSMFAVTVPFGRSLPSIPARAALAKDPGDQLNGAVVLVVDNEYSILAGMEALLSGWGCAVHLAASGDEAIEMLPFLPQLPAVIIADYHLDDGRLGTDEITRLSRAANRPLPGIVITANRTAEVAATIKTAGFWLLNKPVKPAQLRSLLTRALS
jgi:PAS domain S-box-containing protein